MKSIALALALLSSCVIAGSDELSDVEQYAKCADWMCGTNSPLIDSYGFHELDTKGQPNSAGIAITKFEQSGTSYTPSVTGGRLRGYHANGSTIEGVQLVNAKFHLSFRGQPAYVLRVAFVSEAPLWVDGQQTWVPTYLLHWANAGTTRWKSLCSLPDKDMGMQAYHSVLFEGDRIDSKAKTIDPVPQRSWFNIGCAGSTLAKMYLTGHTYASKAHGYDTTIGQRQTMLKMLSGDYCGGGTPYTVAGTPLDWKDDKGWMHYTHAESKLEARWNAHGAACLNTPRIEASQYAPGLAEFPDVAAKIANECSIPTCADPPASDEFVGYHLLSANPP